MASKYKIAILGIGGVGGYVGGKLAAHYSGSNEIEVNFIARGENEKAIKSNGLKLVTLQDEQIIHPHMVTHEPAEIGAADLIICCNKSYDLETGIQSLTSCIIPGTFILPLLNGVDAAGRIKKIAPQAEVLNGCVYVVSKLTAPGIVKESGSSHAVYFGSDDAPMEKLKHMENIFKATGINAHLSENILQTVWEKFLFISPFSTLTSFLDLGIHDILNNKQHNEVLEHLLGELKSIADTKGISLPGNIIQKTIGKFQSLPADVMSSMHRDFRNGNKTETDSLTAYVIGLGKELNIPTPYYEKMLAGLREKEKK